MSYEMTFQGDICCVLLCVGSYADGIASSTISLYVMHVVVPISIAASLVAFALCHRYVDVYEVGKAVGCHRGPSEFEMSLPLIDTLY